MSTHIQTHPSRTLGAMMAALTSNHSIWEAEAECNFECNFEVSLGYLSKKCKKQRGREEKKIYSDQVSSG